MVSIARIDSGPMGHAVIVDWGRSSEVFGPYPFLWMAKFVRWMQDGQH